MVMIIGIITAAGESRRYGSNKLWELIQDRPLIEYSIQALHPYVGRLFLVVASPEDPRWIPLTHPWNIQLVAGGSTRSESVRNGLKKAIETPDFTGVLIHDGARPFLSSALIQRLLAQPHQPMVIPGIPVVDTIKYVNNGTVTHTVDRTNLWQIQTPQYVRQDIITRLLDTTIDATDEAGIAESLGIPVSIVDGDPHNRKITLAGDLNHPTHFP